MNMEVDVKAAEADRALKSQSLVTTYDFLKHMSGLALVAVGGMLGLAQAAGMKPNLAMFLPIGMMSAVAFLSLMFMAMAAGTQILGRVEKTSIKFAFAMVLINVGLFSASVSAFVTGFARSLGH